MKVLKFTYTCRLEMTEPVTDHSFTLRVAPHDDPAQTIELDSCTVEPLSECSTQTDGWGNLLYIGSCPQAHSNFVYSVSGTAHVDSRKGRGTSCKANFAYPSPLTQPADAIKNLYAKAKAADESTDIFTRALHLSHLVYEHMEYDADATNVKTTAEQAAALGRGVCQDYAHILAALLRMDGTPARYVSGLMWGEGATHAWVEFYDGTTWWGLDPTNDCEAGDYYIAIARGRDHSDCPLECGVFKGSALQTQKTEVSVEVFGE